MKELFELIPTVRDIHEEIIELNKSPNRKPGQNFGQAFNQLSAHFAQDKGTVVLLSGSNTDSARYHILAVKPWLHIQSKGRQIQLTIQDNILNKKSDKTLYPEHEALSFIKNVLNHLRLPDKALSASLIDTPVAAGLFGYFSYDLKDQIEKLPQTCMESHLPDICLYAPSLILIQEIKSGGTTLYIPVLNRKDCTAHEWVNTVKSWFYRKIADPAEPGTFSTDTKGFKSSFKKSEYIYAVKKIINYLKAGDIYQANLSQRFETGFQGDSYSLFLELFQRNPAAFFAYVNAGNHQVVSTSPERFIRQKGLSVETRPIKGTIARGKTESHDRENKKELQNSIKDSAELTMIVDLMRNDISRVTCYDTVIVKEHKRLEAYENVYHLVSVIKARLQPDKDSIDLIKATFPGGSITGCPKIRSMEIIDELEPVQRHVYTGSIGYISFHDTMDLSIAIRTAIITKGKIYFSVGGGIVYDSDPEKEYQETLDKGKTIMETLSARSNVQTGTHASELKVWINGKLTEQDQAFISVDSPGFQYGAGIFETIRADKGRILRLEEHLARMNSSWQQLFSEPAPDITWKNVIELLLRENQLKKTQAAVKLIMARQGWEANSLKPNSLPFVAAFAKPYQPRPALIKKQGLDLITYPYPRQSPLASHKSLNYLYYYQAGQYALKKGGDEALILNPDNTVSETNTANILAIDDKTVIVPESEHSLPGVSLKAILNSLTEQGYDIKKKKISVRELGQYPEILLSNSLMGVVKVLSIDGLQRSRTQQIESESTRFAVSILIENYKK